MDGKVYADTWYTPDTHMATQGRGKVLQHVRAVKGGKKVWKTQMKVAGVPALSGEKLDVSSVRNLVEAEREAYQRREMDWRNDSDENNDAPSGSECEEDGGDNVHMMDATLGAAHNP